MAEITRITPRSTARNIQVLDATMGAGKTTYIFEEIERRSLYDFDSKFLYVSPFLAEVGDPDACDDDPHKQIMQRAGRIRLACPSACFMNPMSRPTKRDSLKKLLAEGLNIACTHALYSMIDEETADLIEQQGYEVIIDEVLEVIQPFTEIWEHDANFLSDSIEIDPETHLVKWTSPIGEKSQYASIKQLCEEGRLYNYHRRFWLLEIPPALLIRTKKTTICTYLFEASIMHSYFLKHGIAFEYIDNESIGLRSELDLLAEAKELITIEDNPYVSKLGKYAMSYTGYEALSAKDLKTMKGMLEMMVERHLKVRSKDLIWTCYKNQRKSLKGKGYARGFLAFNTRGINKYRDRSVGIYLIDRYPHSLVNQFLRGSGVAIDPDLYGLSEMIQWVWRLRIREGKDIRLVIPSKRMRNLLVRWLNGEFIREDINLAA